MSKEPRGLGKGLNALLAQANDADKRRKPVSDVNKEIMGANRQAANTADILRIPVEMIDPNPFQPRMSFDQEALNELAASISTLGLIQPVTVRRMGGDRYQIISGERRYKACRIAGMTTIPAYVRDTDDQGMLEMAIVENLQRENLDPIELAMSYQRLIDECSLTQDKLADRVGKKRATVANTLRLRDGLSVRALEDMVRQILNPSEKKEEEAREQTEQSLPDSYYKVLSHIGKYFSKDISLKRNQNGKGTMTIRFDSDDEIFAFLKALEEKQF